MEYVVYHFGCRGVTGTVFWGGKVIIPNFFPGVKCFFPVENFHFGRPKTNKKTKQKQKQKRSSPHFGTSASFHFQFSTFPFTIFLLFFSIFPPFPFFPCLFLPGRSAEISRSEVSGVTLSPCHTPVTPLFGWLLKLTLLFKKGHCKH